MKLRSNQHSAFRLNYHLVMCIEYRKKILDDIISDRLHVIFENICKNYNIMLVEWNHDKDHIHCLIAGHPNTEVSKFINVYKSASSRLIKKEFPIIRNLLWKEYFWSQSFCLITVDGVLLEVLKQYIQSQDM